nr:hypothetical protein [Bryobacter sp.]
MSWRVAVLGAALLAAAVMGFVQYDESVATCCHDNALYLVAGKSLATGQGYKILSLPEQPAQTKYPPLFPFLLSWAWRIAPAFPAVLAWAYALTWVWLPVFVWIGWRYFRISGVPEEAAVLLAAGLALQPHLSIISQSILADVVYAVFAWGALLVLGGNPLAAGALAALAILTKTSGVAVLGAGVLFFALRRRWRDLAIFAALPLAALVAWVAWSSGARMATTDRNLLYYVDYLGLYRRYASLADVPGIAWHNFSVLLSSYGAMVVYNNELSGIIFQFSRLVGIFSVIGLVRRARRVGMEPGLWFGIFFSLQAILWNFPPDPRLACPVLPLIWLGFREE